MLNVNVVFKERGLPAKFGDFRIHCMMDEINKLHLTMSRNTVFANKERAYPYW